MKKTVKKSGMLFVLALFTVLLSVYSFALALGDIDGNGKIEAADARMALRSAVGLDKLSTEQKKAADVDANGQVEAADARLILRAAVGLEKLAVDTENCEHTYGDWTQEKVNRVATGNHIRTCTKCGAQETAACTYDQNNKTWVTENHEPDCTTAAIYAVSCTVCKGSKTKTIPAVGHKETTIPAIEATCTTAGKAVGFECRVCGNIRGNEVLPATGHSLPAVWSTSEDGKTHYCSCQNKNCDYTESHSADYVVATAATGIDIKTLVCPVCHMIMPDNKENRIEAFNSMVNSLKTNYAVKPLQTEPTFVYPTLHYFSRTVMKSEVSDIDFGIWTSSVEKMYADEMTNTTTYTPLYTNKSIFWLPLTDSDTRAVSELTADDVAYINVEYKETVTGTEILNGYDSDFTTGSGDNVKSYSIAAYKTKTFNNVIKVTVKVNQLDADSVSEFNAVKNGGTTALNKITDTDIKEDLSQFTGENYKYSETDSEDGVYSIQMDMTLTRLRADGTVTYYFDAENLAPIAAVYDTSVEMWQDLYMDFRLFNSDKEGVTGTMKPYVQTDCDQVYLFAEYFN